MQNQNAVVIGITGGIGTGKSEVARIIMSKGFPVLSSDDIAKELMQSDETLINRIKKEFGDDIYEDNLLNKEKLASLVFGESKENIANQAKLNSIVHPVVIDRLLLEIETLSRNGAKLIFNESALIYEANLEDGYDAIVVVDTPDEIRYQRLRESRGMTVDEIRSRIERQIAQSEKRKAADFVIDNSGDLQKLEKAVNFILNVAQAIEPKDFTILPIDDEE